jgi:hypothetical protein
VLKGKTAYEAAGGYPLEADIDAQISPAGGHSEGNLEWHIGYSSSGTLPFTLTWSKDPSNVLDLYVGQFQTLHYSKTNPNVILPPGASETYISYPLDVRALLQPDYPILEKDAVRPCPTPLITEKVALEIARYAYRAGEIERGNCWTMKAAGLGSYRARVLEAVGYQMGWRGPRNDTRAFGELQLIQSHKEPWGLLFLMNAYEDGRGTPRDTHQASIITSYMLTHDDAMKVVQMVGSDDVALTRMKK